MKERPILIYLSGDDAMDKIQRAARIYINRITEGEFSEANAGALAALTAVEQSLLDDEENAAREAHEDTQKAAGMQAND